MAEYDSTRKPIDDAELLARAMPIDPSDLDEPDLVQIGEGETHGPDDSSSTSTKIRSTEHDRRHHHENWNRKPNVTGQGAIHVKTFVAKLRLDAVRHLDEQVNTWLDAHPEYEVKFVTSSVGDLVGKNTEPALFLTVWV